MHLVDSGPRRLFLRGRFPSSEIDFYLQAIQGATKRDAAGRTGSVTVKAVFASGNDGGLELQNQLVA